MLKTKKLVSVLHVLYMLLISGFFKMITVLANYLLTVLLVQPKVVVLLVLMDII